MSQLEIGIVPCSLAPPLVRDMETRELETIVELWVDAWRVTAPHIDFEARREWLARRLIDIRAAGGRILAAANPASGRLLGFVTIDPQSGWLDQLAVSPDWQGAGVATRLLEAAKALSPACVRLDVNQDNVRALRFYQREGFRLAAAGLNPRSGAETWALEWRAP